ncbi:MAG: HTH domain-containing protein [Prolixibacteraceae bacterium]|nr:HTH domain-containing protein [Prolixibacteraceae bacterium]
MDQPKLDRLLRLMKMLTGNVSYSVLELSDRLEITPRSVYRYIDTFREAGFVIKKRGNIFRIDKSSPYFKDISSLIHFTEEEAYILKSAIESIDENNLIKQNLKKKLYTVYDYKILAETIVKGKNAKNVNSLIEAIENERQVVLQNYNSAHSHGTTNRLVEPFAFTTNYIQLWAYEPASQMNKLFKISRIGLVKINDETWQQGNKHKAGYIDAFRISSHQQIPVKLKLKMRAAQLLIEE